MDNRTIERALKEQLDGVVATLDSTTLSELNQVRREALESKRLGWRMPAFLGMTAFASAALLLVVLMPSGPLSLLENDPGWIVSMEPETLELYESLDFYEWLAERKELGQEQAG